MCTLYFFLFFFLLLKWIYHICSCIIIITIISHLPTSSLTVGIQNSFLGKMRLTPLPCPPPRAAGGWERAPENGPGRRRCLQWEVAGRPRHPGLYPSLLPGVRSEFGQIDTSNPNCVVIADAGEDFSYQNMHKAFQVLMELEKPILFSLGKG